MSFPRNEIVEVIPGAYKSQIKRIHIEGVAPWCSSNGNFGENDRRMVWVYCRVFKCECILSLLFQLEMAKLFLPPPSLITFFFHSFSFTVPFQWNNQYAMRLLSLLWPTVYPRLLMISKKCSLVTYLEFSTHGSGNTTNNAGNIEW